MDFGLGPNNSTWIWSSLNFLFNCRRTTLNKNDISAFEANVFLYAIVDVDV